MQKLGLGIGLGLDDIQEYLYDIKHTARLIQNIFHVDQGLY